VAAVLGQIVTKVYSVDQVVSPYIYVFYASFLLAFVFTPIMRTVAVYYRIIDRPDRVRKMHKVPVAYLGGVAVFMGWLGGLAISEFTRLHRMDPGWPTDAAGVAHPVIRFGIVMGALLIVCLGLWDDIFKLRPWMKIVGQVCAALFLLQAGIGVECLRPILDPLARVLEHGFGFDPPGAALPSWTIVGASSIFVILIVVGCCNATNLMDGLDGLCGGVTAVIAAGFLFVSVHQAIMGGVIHTNIDAQRVILALALLGALLGFVPFNFNPASIFMGDTGSMLLGFVCATMIILMGQGEAKWFLAGMVIFALPILDTALALARRWTNRRPVFSADNQHFHHQLVARGFTVKQTVLINYGLAIFFGLLGISMVFLRQRYAVAIYLVVFGAIMVTAYKMGMVHERPARDSAGTLDDAPAEAFAAQVDPESVMEITEPAAADRESDGRPIPVEAR